MNKKKLTAFDGIQLVGIHKEPTFGPRENKKNPYEYCKEHKTISAKTTAGCPFCLQAENMRLKEFARPVIKHHCWNLFDMDGAEIQDLAEKLGLIVPHLATKDDVDDESDYGVGDTIFKFSKLLQETGR